MLSNYKRILDLSPDEFEHFRHDLARVFGLSSQEGRSFKPSPLFGQWTQEDIHAAFERLDQETGGKLLFASPCYCVGSQIAENMPLMSNPIQLPVERKLLSQFIK